MPSSQERSHIDDLKEDCYDDLTEWEQGFITSLAALPDHAELSDRQADVLERLVKTHLLGDDD